MDREEEIRLIAYQIWEEEGNVNGLDANHWQRAELIWENRRKQNNPCADKKPVAERGDKRKKKKTNKKL
ncbi:MAG: DUF2934 domain-containing protein [Dehalococcoidia bacterium]|jgi:hypothetical protein